MSISIKTHKMLWGRHGNRCAMPTCRKVLFEDETETDDASLIGDEAHIIAREINGPRGISNLTPHERDKFDNLLLLCKNDHKIIDDQPNKYTVDVLRNMKNDHLEWVRNTLSPDFDKQKEDEIYATYIDKWIALANIDHWKSWTSYILEGPPQMLEEIYDQLKELNQYLLARIWPKRYPKIEFGFMNFRIILNDFIHVFDTYKKKMGVEDAYPYYSTIPFYKGELIEEHQYQNLIKEYEYHLDLLKDLICELTRVGNYLCDQIRKHISSSFRMEEGALLITAALNMDFSYTTMRLEFENYDTELIRYQGLKWFMQIRESRDFNFGKGILEKYFNKTPYSGF